MTLIQDTNLYSSLTEIRYGRPSFFKIVMLNTLMPGILGLKSFLWKCIYIQHLKTLRPRVNEISLAVFHLVLGMMAGQEHL